MVLEKFPEIKISELKIPGNVLEMCSKMPEISTPTMPEFTERQRTCLKIGGGILVGTVAVPALFTAVGFSSTGVVLGSPAALIHSTLCPIVGKGTIFATIQSITTTSTVSYVGAVTGGAVAAVQEVTKSTKAKD